MSDAITGPMLDRFFTSAGPARLSLMTMVRPQINRAADFPSAEDDALNPVRYLFEQARDGAAPLDEEFGLPHEYAIAVNQRLGFDSPAWVDGCRTHLEIDTLLTLTRSMGATMSGDGREVLTPVGQGLLGDSVALWRAAAWAIPTVAYPNKKIADIWELLLAWLVADGELFEAQYAALAEVAGHSSGAGLETIFSVATCSLYTLGRAMNMFVPRARHVLKKPRLTNFGRATAIEALRSAALFKWNEGDAMASV
jgi:hypothetical protein